MKKLLVFAFLGPLAALGHEGHGGLHGDLIHQFSSLWHLIPIVSVLIAAVLIARKYIKDRYKNA